MGREFTDEDRAQIHGAIDRLLGAPRRLGPKSNGARELKPRMVEPPAGLVGSSEIASWMVETFGERAP